MRTSKDTGRAELGGNSALPSSDSGRRQEATRVPFVTAAQMAEVDRRTVRDYGIGLLQMMELAGRSLAEHARRMLGGSVMGRQIVVLCGTGNNGGGGMVSARHLHGWGAEVQAILVGSEARLKPIAKRQWSILERIGLGIGARTDPGENRPDLIVDAIFGYGFRGRPRPAAARWIEWANDRGCPILALDLPSGLDATSGVPGTPCIRAAVTLTLALPKTGLSAPEAAPYVGDLYLADIGIVPEVYREMGLEVGHPFEDGSIILLSESKET